MAFLPAALCHLNLILQKNVDASGVETLNPSDKLYVVHVKQQGKDKDRAWNSGGPLLPGLETALSRYPHSVVELEVTALLLAARI